MLHSRGKPSSVTREPPVFLSFYPRKTRRGWMPALLQVTVTTSTSLAYTLGRTRRVHLNQPVGWIAVRLKRGKCKGSMTKHLRRLEVLLFIVGLLLISIFVAAYIHRATMSRRGLTQF